MELNCRNTEGLLAVPLHAKDDMQEKIRLLEQQIQELKTLQTQQACFLIRYSPLQIREYSITFGGRFGGI